MHVTAQKDKGGDQIHWWNICKVQNLFTLMLRFINVGDRKDDLQFRVSKHTVLSLSVCPMSATFVRAKRAFELGYWSLSTTGQCDVQC